MATLKPFIVTLQGFGKRIEERVEAADRDAAAKQVCDKYGVSVQVKVP